MFFCFSHAAVGSTCSILLLHCFSEPLLSCQLLSSNVCPLRSLTPLPPVCFWAAHPPDPLFRRVYSYCFGAICGRHIGTIHFFSARPKNTRTVKRPKRTSGSQIWEGRPAGSNHHGRSSNSPPHCRLPLTSSPSLSPSYLSLLLTNLCPRLVRRVIAPRRLGPTPLRLSTVRLSELIKTKRFVSEAKKPLTSKVTLACKKKMEIKLNGMKLSYLVKKNVFI